MCITYSSSFNSFFLVYRRDKAAEAAHRFGFEVLDTTVAGSAAVRAEASPTWSAAHSHDIGATGSSAVGVRVLDRKVCTSVALAVEKLMEGHISCDEGLCIVFSSSSSSYFLLWRSDMQDE